MQLPREPRSGDKVEAALVAQVVRYLRAITPRGGPGVRVKTTAGGTTFAADTEPGRGGGSVVAGTTCPFDITITETAGPVFTATFRPGTINQLLPSNILTGVVVPATGTRYLVLNCTASNGEITAATFSADSSPPAAIAPYAGQPPVAFKVLIGLVIDTVAFKVWGCGNIQAEGAESFRLQKVSPAAGELPYDIFYTWHLATL